MNRMASDAVFEEIVGDMMDTLEKGVAIHRAAIVTTYGMKADQVELIADAVTKQWIELQAAAKAEREKRRARYAKKKSP